MALYRLAAQAAGFEATLNRSSYGHGISQCANR
jgi:hypothetical protein